MFKRYEKKNIDFENFSGKQNTFIRKDKSKKKFWYEVIHRDIVKKNLVEYLKQYKIMVRISKQPYVTCTIIKTITSESVSSRLKILNKPKWRFLARDTFLYESLFCMFIC